jgi:transposase-like protein
VKKIAKAKGSIGKASRRTRPYPREFRLQIVHLFLEERYNTSVLREQLGVSGHSANFWAKAY